MTGPSRQLRLAEALRRLIAAVKSQSPPSTLNLQPSTTFATEWLAESYYQQSRSELTQALEAARQASEVSPNFGFAWARRAELEFSFGRTTEALAALEKARQLSPRHAEALALKGFLLAAENKIAQAIAQFDQAIAIDGALGHAWLGRGLCKIRQGKAEAGREDLQMAAALEPQRAVLRSYLGKAFSNAGDNARAGKELDLAKRLDPNDPTSWLYSALLNRQLNRINEAVRDLEKSQDLNKNRSVYRSQLLLDQDRAVRSANLAGIYRDAGLFDVSVREAARAVSSDYANYSAHLFLANSYLELSDPRQINLRYETPAVNEYLLATLLAPVGAGSLSQYVSQQEYSKLFERDRLGVSSSTEYFSAGDWRQIGSQFGTFGNTSYALDTLYRNENGHRVNNDLEQVFFRPSSSSRSRPRAASISRVFITISSRATSLSITMKRNRMPDCESKRTRSPFCWAAIIMSGDQVFTRCCWSAGCRTLSRSPTQNNRCCCWPRMQPAPLRTRQSLRQR